MPFIKGKPKTGGKKRGSRNKVTKDVRHSFQKLLEGNLENMTAWLKRVAKNDPEKAFSLMLQLAEYNIPKLARTELTGKDGEQLIRPPVVVVDDEAKQNLTNIRKIG